MAVNPMNQQNCEESDHGEPVAAPRRWSLSPVFFFLRWLHHCRVRKAMLRLLAHPASCPRPLAQTCNLDLSFECFTCSCRSPPAFLVLLQGQQNRTEQSIKVSPSLLLCKQPVKERSKNSQVVQKLTLSSTFRKDHSFRASFVIIKIWTV